MVTQYEEDDFFSRMSLYVASMTIEEIAGVTVTRLAQDMLMSLSSFYDNFEKVFGSERTPADYILERKIELAVKEIKKDPRLKVATLSKRLGFSSSIYFIQVFKKVMRVTPGKLICVERRQRKEYRKDARKRKALSRHWDRLRKKMVGVNSFQVRNPPN